MAKLVQISFNFDDPIMENLAIGKPEKTVPNPLTEILDFNENDTKQKNIDTNEPLPKDNIKKTRGRLPLKNTELGIEYISIPEDEILFEKQYYSIGQVAKMFKVNQSQIRFWENEFEILKPKKNAKGDRFFKPQDIKNLKLIYHLIREKKYTLAGAKTFLNKSKKVEIDFNMVESLKKIRSFLFTLKSNI